MTAEDSARQVLGERRAIGQHKLHMRFERFAPERLGQGGKRMVGRHDRPHCDTRHELADEIARACWRDRIDRQPGGAVAEPLLRSPESLGVDRRGQKREGDAQRLQALHQKRNRQHRIDRQSELRLDVFSHALRTGADRSRPRDQPSRVADQRFSRVSQLRRLAGSIEQRKPKRRLERLDRLADR
jgi:hypothetical protein